jgi:hypothetical protein
VKDDFKCVNYGNLPVTDHQETGMYFIDVTWIGNQIFFTLTS